MRKLNLLVKLSLLFLYKPNNGRKIYKISSSFPRFQNTLEVCVVTNFGNEANNLDQLKKKIRANKIGQRELFMISVPNYRSLISQTIHIRHFKTMHPFVNKNTSGGKKLN